MSLLLLFAGGTVVAAPVNVVAQSASFVEHSSAVFVEQVSAVFREHTSAQYEE